MNDRELYKQKFQAQLDEWKSDIGKLKAKAMEAQADTRLEMNKMVDELNGKIQVFTGKLSELSEAGEEKWDSMKQSVESAWEALKTSVNETTTRFKK